jgi:hypothetical protein
VFLIDSIIAIGSDGMMNAAAAGPGRMVGNVRPRVQPMPGVVRHLPGDEDEIVADDSRHEARCTAAKRLSGPRHR